MNFKNPHQNNHLSKILELIHRMEDESKKLTLTLEANKAFMIMTMLITITKHPTVRSNQILSNLALGTAKLINDWFSEFSDDAILTPHELEQLAQVEIDHTHQTSHHCHQCHQLTDQAYMIVPIAHGRVLCSKECTMAYMKNEGPIA